MIGQWQLGMDYTIIELINAVIILHPLVFLTKFTIQPQTHPYWKESVINLTRDPIN